MNFSHFQCGQIAYLKMAMRGVSYWEDVDGLLRVYVVACAEGSKCGDKRGYLLVAEEARTCSISQILTIRYAYIYIKVPTPMCKHFS